jgi:transposase
MPSIDLMVHISYFYLQEYSFRQIEKLLNIPKSTSCRWYNYCKKYFTDTKDTNVIIDKINKLKEESKMNKQNMSINKIIIQFINKSLCIQPFQTHQMLQNKIQTKFKIFLTPKMISTYIKLAGFSKKKVTRRLYNIDINKHLLKRKQFLKKVKKIKHQNIISVDESGINRHIFSNYGYSKIGKRLTAYYSLKNFMKNHSLIMAINNKKVVKQSLYDRSINGEIYANFIIDMIKEHKIKKKYILMDNARIHYKAIKAIEESGNYVLFIPPYSPDFNPIEEVFSSMKSYIKKWITPLHSSIDIIQTLNSFVAGHNTSGYYIHSFGIQKKEYG